MTTELLSLFHDDDALGRVFEVVARERKIRFGHLADSLNMDKEDALSKLRRLEEAGLVKSREATGGNVDLRWYYITSKGWTARRGVSELRRLEIA